ncbi:MAG: peptide chain release factor N(5)-glutamine methyltransferase [Candidatus Stygibacter australis]|nr:peptide chain release factor N(5)-glutamine methyltransferase [Candidatus Stygibacter australis]MDP8323172.1 peptide chain release factor N(5)-glutamine methyltransferase [Candidatus Stygibacter australis]
MNISLTASHIFQLFSEISKILSKYSINSPEAEAELIINHFFNISRSQIYLKPDLPVSPEILTEISNLLAKRCQHDPLQYLLGEVEFYNSILKVTPDVLIPRPETELLVDIILQENPDKGIRMCDLGTGSGAIAIALKKARPDWQVTATDISPVALKLARQNAQNNHCQIDFLLSDIFSDIDTKFDLIVSNPPYISESDYLLLESEIFYEPKTALIASEDGLYFYHKIIQSASKYMHLPATLYLEIGAEQSSRITKLAVQAGASKIITKQDYNNFDRIMIIKFS